MVYRGSFSTIGSEARTRIARLNPDGSLHPIQFGTISGNVTTMVINGSTLYVGGVSSVDGTPRGGGCAFDLVTGVLLPWDPGADYYIRTLIVHNGLVYAGGMFQNIGGQPRQRIAALDMLTGDATSWNPIADGHVNALYPSGDSLIVGGEFYSIGGEVVQRLAAVDINTGLASSWQPEIVGGSVTTLHSHADQLFIGGSFSTVDQQSRFRIAAYDLSTGVLNDWTPTWNMVPGTVPSRVNSIMVTSDAVYAVGDYSNIYSYKTMRAFDRVIGQAILEWAPSISETLYTITLSGDKLYIGGQFAQLDEQIQRFGIASMDLTTGDLTSWNPSNYEDVHQMVVKDSILYIIGSFTGAPSSYIRALNINTLLPVPGFNAQSNGWISKIAVSDDRIYVTGSFTMIGGIPRTHIAALNRATGMAIVPWNPAPNLGIRDMVINGDHLYLSGPFTTIAGVPRSFMAALDLTTGQASAWDPSPNTYPLQIVANGPTILAAGNFTTIAGVARAGFAELDAITGSATNWAPDVEGAGRGLAVQDDLLVISGAFSDFEGSDCDTLAAVNLNSGIVSECFPDLDRLPRLLVLQDSLLIIGAGLYSELLEGFTTVGIEPRRGFAVFKVAQEDIVTGFENNISDSVDLTIWPNPVSTELRLSRTVSGMILNVHGQMIFSFTNQAMLDVERLLQGVYILRTDEGEGVRFIVE